MKLNRDQIIYGAGLVVTLLVIASFVVVRKASGQETAEAVSVDQETPEGESMALDHKKTDGYMRSNVTMLWDSVQEDLEGSPTTEQIEEERDSRMPSSSPAVRSADDLKADLLSVSEPEPPARPKGGGGGGSRPARPMTQQERDDKVRHDYELATEIAQRIYATDPSEQASAGQTDSVQEESVPERITVPASAQRSSSSLSSLDDGWGGGLSSLDSTDGGFPQDESRPYRCMFTRDERIRSGQRVTLRLLEDMVVDGVVIPANAHITAVCSIKDRLLVSVTSFEMNGRIHTLDFAGYDNDGALGIYCPGVNDSAAKTARNDAMDLGRGVARSRIGAVANGLLSTGVTIAKAAGSGEQSVTVPAGYTFYIMKNTRK